MKIWQKIKEKRVMNGIIRVFVGVFLAGLVLSGQTLAAENWGPERTTFKWDAPATYPTFNSMTDNPSLGDERNFVRVREAGVGNYTDNIEVLPGKEYEVYVYYHNNASETFNESGKGIANNVRLLMQLPKKIEGGTNGEILGKISATNTNPKEVYDKAFLQTKQRVFVRYIEDSAIIFNKGTANGAKLDNNDLFNNGAKLAHYKEQWGMVPGCNDFAGYVTFRVKIERTNFFIEKVAAVEGGSVYGPGIEVKPGEEVNFKIVYTNFGNLEQKSVVFKDSPDEKLSYIKGSSLATIPGRTDVAVSDKIIDEKGIALGDFKPGEKAILKYKMRVADEKSFNCGENRIYNEALVSTADGSQKDKALVIVKRACLKDPKEIPQTGPMEIAMAGVIVATIIGGVIYFVYSRFALKKAMEKASFENKEDGGNNLGMK